MGAATLPECLSNVNVDALYACSPLVKARAQHLRHQYIRYGVHACIRIIMLYVYIMFFHEEKGYEIRGDWHSFSGLQLVVRVPTCVKSPLSS